MPALIRGSFYAAMAAKRSSEGSSPASRVTEALSRTMTLMAPVPDGSGAWRAAAARLVHRPKLRFTFELRPMPPMKLHEFLRNLHRLGA